MGRLLKNIALFVLPLLLVVVVLNPDKRYRYKELKDDCLSKGIWMYDRIHNNEKPIDVLFMGSSHTINAVNDALLNEQLDETSVNFGYCRLGRNLQYVLLSEIVSKKKPNTLILEIRSEENPYSHPIFPYIATSRAVAQSLGHLNPDFISDIWKHGNYKLELSQEKLFQSGDSLHIFPWDHGHKVAPDTISPELLETLDEPKNKTTPTASPKSYLRAIKNICERNKIELIFLYLPNYAEHQQKARMEGFYSNLGTIWYPPTDILSNKDFWFDKEHLNTQGSKVFSAWLKEMLDADSIE